MPILPENKHLYPSNWKIEIVPRILKRDNYMCKKCKLHHHAVGYRDDTGKFNRCGGNLLVDQIGYGLDPNNGEIISYKRAKEWADWETQNDELGNKYIVIVLTVAHLDHNPANCDDKNLAALCQKCHNSYDAPHRAITRKRNKYSGMNKLF